MSPAEMDSRWRDFWAGRRRAVYVLVIGARVATFLVLSRLAERFYFKTD